MARVLQFLLCRKRKRTIAIFLLLSIFLFSLMGFNSNSVDHPDVCTAPKQDLLYIKMIKCASETLAAVFRRYAYTRNLSIVLPIKDRMYLGWPYSMDHQTYRPSKTGSFKFLLDHSVYNEEFMSDLMLPDTAFVTSLREPYSQFKSMFNYYNLAMVSNMSFKVLDPVTEYLTHIEKYEKAYKSHEMAKKRYCIPDGYSMSRNLMAFNLGFPAGKPDGTQDDSDDDGYVQYFLASIESKFKLVMIVEHFDESMLLLKRLMCWQVKDILYQKRNIGQYMTNTKNVRREKENIKIYRKWSSVDYKLYNHFKKVFWQKIKDEGSGFYNELRYYKKLNRVTNQFCQDLDSETLESYHRVTIANSTFTDSFVLDKAFCKVFGSSLSNEVKSYYDKLPVPVDPVWPQREFC